jgi:hypothetical protein
MNSMELDNEIFLIRSPFPKIADPVVIKKLQELWRREHIYYNYPPGKGYFFSSACCYPKS